MPPALLPPLADTQIGDEQAKARQQHRDEPPPLLGREKHNGARSLGSPVPFLVAADEHELTSWVVLIWDVPSVPPLTNAAANARHLGSRPKQAEESAALAPLPFFPLVSNHGREGAAFFAFTVEPLP